MAFLCRVCGSTDGGGAIELPETMFGTGESFAYAQCADCGCMQILAPPESMAAYYPDDYYSYASDESFAGRLRTTARTLLAYHGPAWLFGARQWWTLGNIRSLRDAGVSRSDRILDLGCGGGAFIVNLRDIGFRHVLGADPFIERDIVHPNGARVLKSQAGGLEGPFDVVMMHHSLEHIWDQRAAAADLARLLAPGGRCIIRIPTIESWAWEAYGPDWVQLDPPRHFYLHSRRSITRLLEAAALEVTGIVDDSAAFGILGSEKIRRRRTLMDAATGDQSFEAALPPDLIAAAPGRARDLNKAGRGDAIAVHARKRA